jgi:hypothetical protein
VRFYIILMPPRRVTPYAENYIRHPPTLSQRYGGEMIAFFVAEAKASAITGPLEGHLPQVLLELVACAKHLRCVTFCASSMPLTFCA